MKIGILQVGKAPDELIDTYGSYAEMFVALLSGNEYAFEFRTYEACDGEFPQVINECDGWIITGSKHGVYELHPWISTLSQLITEIYHNKLPLVGICFGHQIIAQALGGLVQKSNKGWGIGLDTYQLNNKASWMSNLGDDITLNIIHQDQVVEPPKDAVIYASSDFCENAGFYIDNSVLTIQAHPEFLVDFTAEILALRSALTIPKEVVDPALIQLDKCGPTVGSQDFSAMIGQFFQSSSAA
ncbi:MAG: gamma-glutamyl-gamma-aminobutyrate hydrolase family protein [Gammaproteobacteria bacterium]|jgi:GMP synthase-like glutamine amidotransferase